MSRIVIPIQTHWLGAPLAFVSGQLGAPFRYLTKIEEPKAPSTCVVDRFPVDHIVGPQRKITGLRAVEGARHSSSELQEDGTRNDPASPRPLLLRCSARSNCIIPWGRNSSQRATTNR